MVFLAFFGIKLIFRVDISDCFFFCFISVVNVGLVLGGWVEVK